LIWGDIRKIDYQQRRPAVSVVGGFIFANPAYHFMAPYIGDAGEVWNLMTGACAAGFMSWSVASMAAKTIARWHSLSDVLHPFRKPVPVKRKRRKRKAKPKVETL
jgi:hypothetical protein